MSPVPPRFERVLWACAFVALAAAGGALLWRRGPELREAAIRAVRDAEGALEACMPITDPPATGPVRLPTCRGGGDEIDPWTVDGAHGPGLEALAAISPDPEERRWAWEDVNSVPVLRWDGDVRVARPGAVARRLSVRVPVDLNRAHAMERAFGYDVDRAVIRYRTDEELASKRASLDAVLGAHGVVRRRAGEGDVLSPDYEWMIEASLEDVRPVARAILSEARRRGARGLREEFGAFASFVQQLRYGESPAVDDGKHRFGLSMPAWALATDTGDCDTRAVLLAALARSVRLCEVHLVRDAGHAHMLAAAEIPVQRGDAIVRAGERTLVLVETTDEWPVGRVPEQTRGASLQTLYLDGSERLSRGAGRPGSLGPRPIAMRAPLPAPAPRTSARPMPAR
ncbi:MAG: hypothetical protein RI990_1247 [Planctomycetota bacterium]|jgi:hypothetical protein